MIEIHSQRFVYTEQVYLSRETYEWMNVWVKNRYHQDKYAEDVSQ